MLHSTQLWIFSAELYVVLFGHVFVSRVVAQNQPPEAPDAYQANFDRGLSEYEAGRYEAAAEVFQAAYSGDDGDERAYGPFPLRATFQGARGLQLTRTDSGQITRVALVVD